jgi:hypothetical protein
LWQEALDRLNDVTAELASHVERVVMPAADHLVVTMADAYHYDACCQAERKTRLEQALAEVAGRRLKIDFQAGSAMESPPPAAVPTSRGARLRQAAQRPIVQRAAELFHAETVDVREG